MSTEAVIDLSAFGANIRHLQATVAPAELMVVLKADAYGHGVRRMAVAAVEAGARRLGVLDIDSALAIRAAGVPRSVTVMAWQYPPHQDFSAAVTAGVELGVSQISELRAVARAVRETTAAVHLKIDTGLNRNGASRDDWPDFVDAARALRDAGTITIAGVWSHIAEASEDEDTLALQRFTDAVEVARERGVEFPIRHLAASSAGLRRRDVRFDMVRMGGHCWGIPSFDGVTPADIGIIPVMTLRSEVTSVRDTESGRVATIPLGYADGIPFRAAGVLSVAVHGHRCEIVRVALDELEIAASDRVTAGDSVVLFGTGDEGEQTVREWGDLTDTLGDEIVTRIAADIPRRYEGSARV